MRYLVLFVAIWRYFALFCAIWRYFALFFSFYAQIKHLYGLLLLDLVPYQNLLEHPNDPPFILCKAFFDVLDTGIYFVLPFQLND